MAATGFGTGGKRAALGTGIAASPAVDKGAAAGILGRMVVASPAVDKAAAGMVVASRVARMGPVPGIRGRAVAARPAARPVPDAAQGEAVPGPAPAIGGHKGRVVQIAEDCSRGCLSGSLLRHCLVFKEPGRSMDTTKVSL